MTKFDEPEVLREFQEVFKAYSPTPEEMMWLIKLIKHIRGRCRSNVALYSYLRRNFPALYFMIDDNDQLKIGYRTSEDSELNGIP